MAADRVSQHSRAGVNERGKTQRAGPANEQRRARTGADEGQPAQLGGGKRAGATQWAGTNGGQQTNGDDKQGPVSSSTHSRRGSSGSRGAPCAPPPPTRLFPPLYIFYFIFSSIYMYIHYLNKKKLGEIWVPSPYKYSWQVLAAP